MRRVKEWLRAARENTDAALLWLAFEPAGRYLNWRKKRTGILMRQKSPVYGNTLRKSTCLSGKAYGTDGRRFQLLFEDTYGIAGVEGRELIVTMTGQELASAIGSIPALQMDEDDMRALVRITKLLEAVLA